MTPDQVKSPSDWALKSAARRVYKASQVSRFDLVEPGSTDGVGEVGQGPAFSFTVVRAGCSVNGAMVDGTGLSECIEGIIRPTVEGMGFDIVRVQVLGTRKRRLQVMAEHRDGRPMTVDDCVGISRALAVLLDVEDPIFGSYTLEVSSPGIERPLVRLDDFRRFAGFAVRVDVVRPVDGRKRFRGRLLGVDEDVVRIQIDDGEVELPYEDIRRANLLMTDELLAQTEESRRQ